jgi:sugar lactone lactonase YvrE
MVQHTATPLVERLGTPESLRWHEGALWFSDLAHGSVHRWTRPGGVEAIVDVPGRAGGLGWLPDGRLLAVSMDGAAVYRREPNGSLVLHCDLSTMTTGPVNDMIVDELGRAYVGSFGFDYYAHLTQGSNSSLYAPPGPPTAPLVVLNPDGTVLTVTDPLQFPNGCAFTGQGTLVVAETYGLRLTEFDIAADGTPINPRPWAPLVSATLWRSLNSSGVGGRIVRRVSALMDKPAIAERSSSPIAPDGIALHIDGETMWVANALRGECVRVARGGRIVDRVKTSQYALDCLVGEGDEASTLFIATVPHMDPRESQRISGGRLEVISL